MHRSVLPLALFSSLLLLAQPDNDDPCTATELTVGSICNYTPATTLNATSSAGIPAPGCAAYLGGDVWFTVTVPSSGAVVISTETGSMTDGGMAVYTAPDCNGTFTLVSCDDDSSPDGSMPQLIASGQVPGSTLYVRTWEFNNDNPGTFGICATVTGPCGLPENSDFCPDPAFIVQGPGMFASTTDDTFSPDLPGNLGAAFCGTIENNSWYQFTADNTTETFPITSVNGCALGFGIQGVVYEVTYNASGCCTGFTQVSNCYSPGTATTGTITATGLSPGQQYLLMIDGYSNDGCEFAISGWNVFTELNTELISFTAHDLPEGIAVAWKTATEVNSNFFELLHSMNGTDYAPLAVFPGAGMSSELREYGFLHQPAAYGIHYYRLRLTDVNGSPTYFDPVSVVRETDQKGVIALYPNPVQQQLTLQFHATFENLLQLTLYNQLGQAVTRLSVPLTKGTQIVQLPMAAFPQGVYLLETSSDEGKTQHRIIKTN